MSEGKIILTYEKGNCVRFARKGKRLLRSGKNETYLGQTRYQWQRDVMATWTVDENKGGGKEWTGENYFVEWQEKVTGRKNELKDLNSQQDFASLTH